MSGTEDDSGPSTNKRLKQGEIEEDEVEDEKMEEDETKASLLASRQTLIADNETAMAANKTQIADLESLIAEIHARTAEIHPRTAENNARTAEIRARTAEIRARYAEIIARTAEINARTEEDNARAAAIEKQIANLEPTSLRTLLAMTSENLSLILVGKREDGGGTSGLSPHKKEKIATTTTTTATTTFARGSFELCREFDATKVPRVDPSLFLLEGSNRKSSQNGLYHHENLVGTRADTRRIAHSLVVDASSILRFVLPNNDNFYVAVLHGRTLFSEREDILMVYSRKQGVPLFPIHVTMPTMTKGSLCKDDDDDDDDGGLGQVYDDSCQFLEAIGNPLPFVFVTNVVESMICWNGNNHGQKGMDQFKEKICLAAPADTSSSSPPQKTNKRKEDDSLPVSSDSVPPPPSREPIPSADTSSSPPPQKTNKRKEDDSLPVSSDSVPPPPSREPIPSLPPVTMMSRTTVDSHSEISSCYSNFSFEQDPSDRPLLRSDVYEFHDLVYLFCNALFRATAAAAVATTTSTVVLPLEQHLVAKTIHDVVLERGKTYHFPKMLCFPANKKEYSWGSLTVCLGRQPPKFQTSDIKNHCYYVIGKLTNGSNSIVWHALDSNGTEELAIKMYVTITDDEGATWRATDNDFARLANAAVATEVERLLSFYPVLQNKVHHVQLNGFPSIVMPLFMPVPKSDRANAVKSVAEVYRDQFFVTNKTKERYVYNDWDVSWRHVGTYTDGLPDDDSNGVIDQGTTHYILFDLVDLQLLDSTVSDSEYHKLHEEHMKDLVKQSDWETIAAPVAFVRNPVVVSEKDGCQVPIISQFQKSK
jgi:hypothetical protein